MNPLVTFRPLAGLLALGLAAVTLSAQTPPHQGPVGKLYVAETKGDSVVQNGEKIFPVQQALTFDAPGTIIETKAKAHSALVYSNGTGLFVDENSRVQINRFSQEPFKPEPRSPVDTLNEPSVSHSDVHLSTGAVGVCTNRLISGSSMLYTTPQGSVTIRGGRLAIETRADETVVDLLEGDVTVRGGARDVGGQILRPGERAVIRPPAAPGEEPSIVIGPIPHEALAADDARVEVACNGRRAVTFEVLALNPEQEAAGGEAAGAASQEIVANPTVPTNPPNNIVVSPDRLPGT